MTYIEQQSTRHYDAKSIIFSEGDQGTSMFIIQSGRVKIKTRKNSQAITLAVLGHGNMFGEMALIDQGLRSATAIADEETVCLEISQMLFQKNLNTIPKWMRSFFKIIVERLRIANSKAVSVTEKDIARQVILLIDKQFEGVQANRLGQVALSWKSLVTDISLMLLIPEESVDNVLHKILLSHLAISKISEPHLREFVVEDSRKFHEFAKYCAAQLKKNRGKDFPQEYRRQSSKSMEVINFIAKLMNDKPWSPDIDLPTLESRFNEINANRLVDYKSELKALKADGIFDSRQSNAGKVVYSFHEDAITELIQGQKNLDVLEQVKL